MMRNNNLTHERKSPYGIRIHKDGSIFDLFSSTFVRDIKIHFSSVFSKSFNSHGFYTVDSPDERLKELLSFEDHWFLEYDFDKILSSIMHNLIFANKTFVEIAFSKNETNEIAGISIIPFDAIKMISFKRYSWFLSYHEANRKLAIFKIDKNKYIEIGAKELGLRNNALKRITKKLKRLDITSYSIFINDEMGNKVPFDDYKRKQEYLMLKYPKEIGWVSGIDNAYLNESYSLFRLVKLREFQLKCLLLFIEKINFGLSNVSEITKVTGTIKTTVQFSEYTKEWGRYQNGEISTKELTDIIFPKYK